jgi:hypothetical protein
LQRPTTGPRFHWLARAGPDLEIGLDFTPRLLAVCLTGRFTDRSISTLRSVLHDAWTQRPERVLIDATALEGWHAAALTALVEVIEQTVAASPVAIAGLRPGQRRHISRLSEGRAGRIRTFATVAEAVDALLASPGAALPDPATLLAEVRHLHRALLSRAAIDQAKGILMAVCGLDAEAAFAMLAWHARSNRVPLRELAARFVAEVRRRPAGSLDPVQADAMLTDLAAGLSADADN